MVRRDIEPAQSAEAPAQGSRTVSGVSNAEEDSMVCLCLFLFRNIFSMRASC
jgi:hypothetical protein